ncbi:MAG: hypothetical protein JO273_07600 [Methylobacteriaceae bacterium]|nr:hypothetical protein [Methylobacteriaceae bacterium]
MSQVEAEQKTYLMPPQDEFSIAHFLTVADIQRLEQDQTLTVETLALFVRCWLTVTTRRPPKTSRKTRPTGPLVTRQAPPLIDLTSRSRHNGELAG